MLTTSGCVLFNLLFSGRKRLQRFLRCYTERGEEVVPVGIVDECMGTFTAAFLFFSAVRVPIHFAFSEK